MRWHPEAEPYFTAKQPIPWTLSRGSAGLTGKALIGQRITTRKLPCTA
jgi:hypothetical protein